MYGKKMYAVLNLYCILARKPLFVSDTHTRFYECVHMVASCSPSRSDYTVSATYRQIHNC